MENLIKLIALESVLAIYSIFLLLAWNWAIPNKPISFWIAFSIIQVIRFIALQFKN